MNIRLYEKRLIDLETHFENTRAKLQTLLEKLSSGPCGEDVKTDAKLQLDMAVGIIRILKEEVAYCLKLGKLYDLARFHDEFVEALMHRNAALAMEITEELDKRWDKK
jgi:hypothetical protein